MRFNVNNELFQKREITAREIVDDINNTTIDEINQLFKDYFNLEEMAVFLYGAVNQ